MPDVTVIDPLGRQITLHEYTWVRHILRGHPDLATHRNRIENILRNPVLVCYSRSFPSCRLYYDAGDASDIMICVVADVSIGVVKTAYRASKIKAGGAEWPASTESKGI